jgi:hypothetical protein
METPHCPIMGAQGFLCTKNLNLGWFSFYRNASRCYFQQENTLVNKLGLQIVALTIFLPEVCNLPLGIRWPLDIGFADFKRSIQGALGLTGNVFLEMLANMDEMLDYWFQVLDKFWA